MLGAIFRCFIGWRANFSARSSRIDNHVVSRESSKRWGCAKMADGRRLQRASRNERWPVSRILVGQPHRDLPTVDSTGEGRGKEQEQISARNKAYLRLLHSD